MAGAKESMPPSNSPTYFPVQMYQQMRVVVSLMWQHVSLKILYTVEYRAATNASF